MCPFTFVYLFIVFFLFSLNKWHARDFYYLYALGSTLPTMGAARLLFAETKWHARWDVILLPSLLRFEGRQNSWFHCSSKVKAWRCCIKYNILLKTAEMC